MMGPRLRQPAASAGVPSGGAGVEPTNSMAEGRRKPVPWGHDASSGPPSSAPPPKPQTPGDFAGQKDPYFGSRPMWSPPLSPSRHSRGNPFDMDPPPSTPPMP